MGFFMSKLISAFSAFGQHPARILMLGLDAAGKTTILYKMKLNETVTTIPTIGFNVEEVSPIKNVTFTVWDVGGQEKIRALWRHYFKGTEGLVFVVDSSDVSRMQEAKKELDGILNDDDIEKGMPILILANKQDLPNALHAHELIEKMNMRDIKIHPWHVQEMCAVSGDGLFEGIHQLATMVKEFQKIRHRRHGF